MMTPELRQYMDSLYDRTCVVVFGVEVRAGKACLGH